VPEPSPELKDYYKKFYEAWKNTVIESSDISVSNFSNSKNSTSQNSEDNHIDTYKKFYEVWEKSASEALETWVNSPIFASNMGKTINSTSDVKIQLNKIVEGYLKSMRLPTKGDVNKALASIVLIEEKLNDLLNKVDRLSKKKAKSR